MDAEPRHASADVLRATTIPAPRRRLDRLSQMLRGHATLWRGSSSRRRSVRAWIGWLALAASLLVYGLVSWAMHAPFHEGARALSYFDLRTYRGAAIRALHGIPLYGRPILHGLGMTYPPFAALLFAPLGLLTLRTDEVAVTVLNVILLVWMLRRTQLIPFGARLIEMRSSRSRTLSWSPTLSRSRSEGWQAWSWAALAAAMALWLEPVSVTLGYGQINLLIAALVVFDLSRPDGARWKGAATGLAAAIKLTPLLLLVYLLVSGRRRAAAVGAGVFAASIALSGAILRQDTSTFWGGRFLQASHVGNASDPANQSLRGALLRWSGQHTGGGWELDIIVALGVVLGLALAVRAAHGGDEAAGFSLAALTTLLVSPISWTHHWTLAVPALFLLVRRAYGWRSWPLAAGAGVLALVGYSYLPERAETRLHHAGFASLLSDPYVIVAVATVAVTAAVLRRQGALRQAGHSGGASRALRAPGGRATVSAARP